MQNPNEDTEWNDILRKHGIIPERPKTPPSPPPPPSPTIAEKLGGASDSALKELEDDAGDSETERIVQEYRRKRMQEFRKEQKRGRFGEMMPIGRDDYKREVTEASRVDEEGMEGRGFGQPVVCYLYKDGQQMYRKLPRPPLTDLILLSKWQSRESGDSMGDRQAQNDSSNKLNPEIESILRALGMIPEKAPAQPRANREDSGSEDEVQRLSSTLRGTKLREPKQGTGTVNAQTSKIRGPSKPTVEDDDSDFDL
ncbi:phosducin, partial [Rhizoctonia solani]